MSRPKLFIGSSKKNVRAAKVLGSELEDVAEVTVWNEGVFGLNEGFLERLLRTLDEFDFAAFVLAADDITQDGDQAKPSPRDNVLFESGLFMGVLGRERVFLVCDASKTLKIPSDLSGVSLASYDGAKIEGERPAEAVRKAALVIGDKIRASRFPHLLGEWSSRYPYTLDEGAPLVDEVLEVKPARDGVAFVTKTSSRGDFYTALGRLVVERQIVGRWNSMPGTNDMEGLFVLTVSPGANFMYGYFSTPDATGGTAYGTWVLAKKVGADERKVEEALVRAQEILSEKTLGMPKATLALSPIVKYDRYSRALDSVKVTAIREAKSEIWMTGATMHHTLTNSQSLLCERITAGAHLNVLVADPEGGEFEATAHSFGQEKADLEGESLMTLRACRRLQERLSQQGDVAGTFNVRILDAVFTVGAYFFDPETEDGRMILVPHLPGLDAAEVPGFVLRTSTDGPLEDYLALYRKLWKHSSAVPFRTWLERHPSRLGS